MSDDSADPKVALPRSLGRWRLREEDGALVATDSVGERRAEIVRVPFGVAAVAEREAQIGLWRGRTSVTHAGLRAVLDGGPWEDDAFVALEALAGPTETLEAFLARDPDAPSRLRVVSELLGAASVLAHAGLRLASISAVIDGYGQPKLSGLESASAGEGLDPRILALAASIDPDSDRAARIRNATQSELESLARELARDGKVVASSFASDAARGEAALDGASRSRQMQIAMVVIAVALLVIVVVALASR